MGSEITTRLGVMHSAEDDGQMLLDEPPDVVVTGESQCFGALEFAEPLPVDGEEARIVEAVFPRS